MTTGIVWVCIILGVGGRECGISHQTFEECNQARIAIGESYKVELPRIAERFLRNSRCLPRDEPTDFDK